MALPCFPENTTFRVVADYCDTGQTVATTYPALRPALAAIGAATGDVRLIVESGGLEIEVIDLTEAATRCWQARLAADAAA